MAVAKLIIKRMKKYFINAPWYWYSIFGRYTQVITFTPTAKSNTQKWKHFHFATGSYQSILITPEFSYPSSYWTTTREEKFEFSILGTDNAILLLSTYPDHETDTIEISIGEEDNTRTRITNNKNKVTKDGYTPGILDINTSTMFWLTWSGKKIRLGRKHSEEVLVELKFDQPFPLRFITPKTISTFASFWHFPYVTGM